MSHQTHYSLVSIELASMNDVEPDDIVMRGNKCCVYDNVHCVGMMNIEAEANSWGDILEFSGVTPEMIDHWYTANRQDYQTFVQIDLILSVTYTHHYSTPYSPEEYDVDYKLHGIFNVNEILKNAVIARQKEGNNEQQ